MRSGNTQQALAWPPHYCYTKIVRTEHHSLNHTLGIVINSIMTLALMGSVGLLVTALPSHKEEPLRLLGSGAALWFTNVLVFALWYWRLDGGGPTARHQRRQFGSR